MTVSVDSIWHILTQVDHFELIFGRIEFVTGAVADADLHGVPGGVRVLRLPRLVIGTRYRRSYHANMLSWLVIYMLFLQ